MKVDFDETFFFLMKMVLMKVVFYRHTGSFTEVTDTRGGSIEECGTPAVRKRVAMEIGRQQKGTPAMGPL